MHLPRGAPLRKLPDLPDLADLPVLDVLSDVRRALAGEASAVLVAPPGAGKTTVVPLALLDEGWLDGRTIVMLEPRRLAARAAATRMSALLGEDGPGGTVGYRVRMDTRVSARTRIEVVTEGVLPRMLQDDPGLEGVGAVLFDEFHERSLHADLGLALTLHARSLLRQDLRVLVMSATLEPTAVAELLDGAPVIRGEGRQYPVETRYRERPVRDRLEPAVIRAVRVALDEDDGDLLVFLPGAGEIRRVEEGLRSAELPHGVDVSPLFGNLPRHRQDAAIAPSPPGRRKVVLATSIAETSLTIEGVRVVIDAGRMRVPRFDPGTGLTRLETVAVTRDAADQRRGRAGRTAPGVCRRLWTEAEDRGFRPRRRPEILEADLAPLVLELAVWGARPDELRWLDAPPAAAVAQARELLRDLGAVDDGGDATDHGRGIASLGLHPRLAHMLLRGGDLGLGRVACDLAALLGERDVFVGEGGAPDADLRLRLEALRRARAGGGIPGYVRGEPVDRGRLRRALREARHWRRVSRVPADEEVAPREIERAGLTAALAYPDRIGRRREGPGGRYLLSSGRGAVLGRDQPLVRSEWLVAAEVRGGGRDARIVRAAPLSLDEIEAEFGDDVRTVEEVVWDDEAERVQERRRRMLGRLVLAEAPLREPDPTAVAKALAEGVRAAGIRALPWTKRTRQLRERLAFLHRLAPRQWPDVSDDALEASLDRWLGPFLAGLRRLDELDRVNLREALLSLVDPTRRHTVDDLAPTHVEVPSGSRIRIDYSDPEAPALAVQIQEVFGWTRTPTVARGRVPLTMKLLSPARRPAQITTDLASFWERTYHEVKKDLQGRYPKHFWPDDPHSAPATRGLPPGR